MSRILKRSASPLRVGVLLSLLIALEANPALQDSGLYGLGRSATEADITPWNIDIAPNGEGLPPGQGTVQEGARLYAQKCAGCHGATGTEGPADRLVGGRETLRAGQSVKTIGNYWPYATRLYDHIFRPMPFNAPQSLTPD